jgi:ankyrin repeat protein
MPLVTHGKKKPLYVVPTSSSSDQGPLAHACRNGDLERVRSIIGSDRASLQSVDADGNTPLHVAAMHNRAGVAELLLTQQPDIDLRNNSGETPLYIAAKRGYTELLRLLLDHRADVNATNNDGKNPLMAAVAGSDRRVTEILLENHSHPNVVDNAGDTPLGLAVAKGSAEVVKLLLEHQADANAKDKNGCTPLYAAACSTRNATEIASLLLANGADVNAVSANGETALYRAANRRSKGMVDLLLANHAQNEPATLKGASSAAEIMSSVERKAHEAYKKASRDEAMANVVGGGVACGGGIALTVFGASLASSGSFGGYYLIFWGAIIFGGWRFIKGVFQLLGS